MAGIGRREIRATVSADTAALTAVLAANGRAGRAVCNCSSPAEAGYASSNK